jgi:hypothetical protein
MDLAHCFDVVLHVFEYVVAKNRIEVVVFEGHLVNIHLYFGKRRLYIGRDVTVAMLLFERLHEALLGGYMQHSQFLFKEACFLAKVKPDKAVTLQRQARRAHCIRTRVDTAIREKGPVTTFADRAFHTVAGIKPTEYFQTNTTEQLEVLARDETDEKRDNFLHVPIKLFL